MTAQTSASRSVIGSVKPVTDAELMMQVIGAARVTGVIASLHLTAGPVEVHHRMIGDVGGVPQRLLEVQPLPGAGEACSNRHTLHSLVTGYQAISARGIGRLQECGGHTTSLRVMTFNL